MDNLSSSILVNAGLEVLTRFFGDLEFELTQIPSALIHGSIVGVCSFLGGLVGGRFGVVVGGGIGHQINNFLLPTIRNLGNMLRELDTSQLQNLFDLLISRIQNTVSTVLGQIINEYQHLINFLERFGNNSEIQMIIIHTFINFFSDIHGGKMRLINQ